MLIAVYTVSAFNHRNAELRIQGLALWMRSVHQAFHSYLSDHGTLLNQSGYQVMGVAYPLAPTVSELKLAGYLTHDFPFSHCAAVQVKLQAFANSSCSSSECAMYGLIWALEAVKSNHDFAYWRLSTNAEGAIVTAQRPHFISAVNTELANPPQSTMAALPAGSVAWIITPNTLGLDYLRVGDERNPDFQNHVSVGGGLQVEGVASTGGGLQLVGFHEQNSSCQTSGLISRNAQANSLLICSAQKVWRSMDTFAGGTYTLNPNGQCSHPVVGNTENPYTNACTCPVGYQKALIAISGTTPADTYLTYACRP